MAKAAALAATASTAAAIKRDLLRSLIAMAFLVARALKIMTADQPAFQA
jgi:hypothetical protein